MEVIQLLVDDLHCFSKSTYPLYSLSLGGLSINFDILLSKIQVHMGCLYGFFGGFLSLRSRGGAWLPRSPLGLWEGLSCFLLF